MKQTALFLLPLLALSLLCSCQENRSQESEITGHTSLGTPVPPTTSASGTETTSLKYLEQHIGKKPSEVNLWQTEPLQTRLKELLGEQYDLFNVTMRDARPLQQDRVLYTIGIYPVQTKNGLAVMLVDLENENLHVSFVFDAIRNQFQTKAKAIHVPQEVESRLQQALNKNAKNSQ